MEGTRLDFDGETNFVEDLDKVGEKSYFVTFFNLFSRLPKPKVGFGINDPVWLDCLLLLGLHSTFKRGVAYGHCVYATQCLSTTQYATVSPQSIDFSRGSMPNNFSRAKKTCCCRQIVRRRRSSLAFASI